MAATKAFSLARMTRVHPDASVSGVTTKTRTTKTHAPIRRPMWPDGLSGAPGGYEGGAPAAAVAGVAAGASEFGTVGTGWVSGMGHIVRGPGRISRHPITVILEVEPRTAPAGQKSVVWSRGHSGGGQGRNQRCREQGHGVGARRQVPVRQHGV